MISIKRLSSADTEFDRALSELLAFENAQDTKLETAVADILADIRMQGDKALLEYTLRFDRLDAKSAAELELPRKRLQQALHNLPAEQRNALEQAVERVRAYHEKQLTQSWSYVEPEGRNLDRKSPLSIAPAYMFPAARHPILRQY